MADPPDPLRDVPGPYFRGGPRRDVHGMIFHMSRFRDVGGLPNEASLVLSQLLLNMAGKIGRGETLQLINVFLAAADVPMSPVGTPVESLDPDGFLAKFLARK